MTKILHHPTSQYLFRHWNNIRRDRAMPHRFDIDPTQLSNILSDTFMLEHTNRGTYPFRLAGTRICEYFEAELRGSSFLDFWSPRDRAEIHQSLNALCARIRPLCITFNATSAEGHRISYEMLLLPVTLSGLAVDRILGTMAVARHPPWLGFDPIIDVDLTTTELFHPEIITGAGSEPARISARMAPYQAPRKTGHHPYLKLIEGGLAKRA